MRLRTRGVSCEKNCKKVMETIPWMEQNNSNSLCQIHPIEQLFFERTISVMLNKKNGLLVLDDELVSSHATDVKLKTISNHKSGKKGPVSDCISNSQIRSLFAMRLRTRGVSCEENCKKVRQRVSSV